MPYLTEEEISRHRDWLAEYRVPSEMLDYCEATMDSMADENNIAVALFNQAGVDFVTEAWAAATFGKLRTADAIKVPRDDPPDFFLKFSDRQELWELTEADKKERKRGREYQERAVCLAAGSKHLDDDPVESWVERAEQVPHVLRERATQKSLASYASGTNLLILLNINEFGIRQQEIESELVSATEPAKDKFSSVWVLWKGRAYHLWQDAGPVFIEG